jgi:hypothetical protein
VSRDLQQMTVNFVVFIPTKSYFSRTTRERRKNVQQLQKSLKSSEEALDNDEDLQSQADEDENDFDSAVLWQNIISSAIIHSSVSFHHVEHFSFFSEWECWSEMKRFGVSCCFYRIKKGRI